MLPVAAPATGHGRLAGHPRIIRRRGRNYRARRQLPGIPWPGGLEISTCRAYHATCR